MTQKMMQQVSEILGVGTETGRNLNFHADRSGKR